jgi:hypothetical protein
MAYLLAALAIASVVMTAWARLGNQAADGKRVADLRDAVVAQASLIRSKLLACTMTYPGGNNGLGFRLAFPAAPTGGLVADLLCPGTGTNINKPLWSTSDGIYAPRTLNGLSAWSYAHDAASIRIRISATGSGNVPTAALNNAALRYGAQASVSNGTLTVLIAQ